MTRFRTFIVALAALVAIPAGAIATSSPGGMSISTLNAINVQNLVNNINPELVPALNTSASSGTIMVLMDDPAIGPRLVTADLTARMSILYATDNSVRQIFGGSTEMPTLPWLFRQEPSNSGAGAALAGGGSQRMSKVSGSSLARLKTDAMVARLKGAIDKTCTTPAGVSTCTAHMVAVDEIGAPFGVPVGEEPTSRQPGSMLSAAMIRLSGMESPWGGAYASRVHFYLAPGVSTAISAGLGPRHDLGRDGKARWPDYRDAAQAMSMAGGVWLEMYHYPTPGSPRTPFTNDEWRDVPTNVAAFLKEKSPTSRDPLPYMHFVMTETKGNDLLPGGACINERGATENSTDSILNIPLSPCVAVTTVCRSSKAAKSTSNEVHTPSTGATEMSVARNPPINRIIVNSAKNMLQTVSEDGNTFVVAQATPSGMACQWQRAQTGAVNQRILMNGPAVFRATGNEATVFATLFRQFFIVK